MKNLMLYFSWIHFVNHTMRSFYKMQKKFLRISHRVYQFSTRFIELLALLFSALLFLSGFLFTAYTEDMTSQKVLFKTDNPVIGILSLFFVLTLIFLWDRVISSHPTKARRILLPLVLFWVIGAGCVLVLFGRTVPAADAMSVYSAAESLSLGDTSVIHNTESYLSYYPQQVGLMAFLELLIRIYHLFSIDLAPYHFIKGIYVLLTALIVWLQYKTVHLLWENDRTDCLYLLLAAFHLPLIMYSSFVYGEIPSFAALSAGLYLFLRLCKEGGKWYSFVGSLLLLALGVMLRKNSLIIIIAVCIVALLEALRQKPQLLLFAALCLTASLGILPLTQKIYELRAGDTLRSGVPAMSYFAMGMQESSRANGWYNGYNFDTYQLARLDSEESSRLSRDYMQERMQFFKEHPGYAVSFYWDKYLSQWTDGTYASRQATLATFGGRSALIESFYSGKNAPLYIGFCNLYQNLLYLGVLAGAFLILYHQKRPGLCVWSGLIAVFGGFLFHMIWEANSRYIFTYGLLLMPYCANGLMLLFQQINNTFFPGKFHKNTEDHRADVPQTPPTAI